MLMVLDNLALSLPSHISLLIASVLSVILDLVLCCCIILRGAELMGPILGVSLLPTILATFKEVLDHESSARSKPFLVTRQNTQSLAIRIKLCS
jgi:hypothetical protein